MIKKIIFKSKKEKDEAVRVAQQHADHFLAVLKEVKEGQIIPEEDPK